MLRAAYQRDILAMTFLPIQTFVRRMFFPGEFFLGAFFLGGLPLTFASGWICVFAFYALYGTFWIFEFSATSKISVVSSITGLLNGCIFSQFLAPKPRKK